MCRKPLIKESILSALKGVKEVDIPDQPLLRF